MKTKSNECKGIKKILDNRKRLYELDGDNIDIEEVIEQYNDTEDYCASLQVWLMADEYWCEDYIPQLTLVLNLFNLTGNEDHVYTLDILEMFEKPEDAELFYENIMNNGYSEKHKDIFNTYKNIIKECDMKDIYCNLDDVKDIVVAG